MKSRTYSGEYTLRHWLNLMIKGNIILPEYQRSFVWDENDMERLILSLKNGQFIQPVTIARMNSLDNGVNLILDGQQRLTSLLLFKIGYFPKKEEFRQDDSVAKGDDSAMDDDEPDANGVQIIGWTFHKCLVADSAKNGIESIRLRLATDTKYKKYTAKNRDCVMTDEEIDNFLDSHFLGFSYIVPDPSSSSDEQQFFSTLFRNMNYLGRKLSAMESRKSLYYLNDSYRDYFEGLLEDGSELFSGIRIIENVAPRRIDVVRYLSILSQYHVKKNTNKVMVGYSAFSSRESFYVDYVSYLLNLEQESRTDKFDGLDFASTLGDDKWKERFKTIATTLESLKDKMNLDKKHNAFQSWIDADYWLFGIIYWILFEGKELNLTDDNISEINRIIRRKKTDDNYSRNPNRITNLRLRLKDSIDFFEKQTKRP